MDKRLDIQKAYDNIANQYYNKIQENDNNFNYKILEKFKNQISENTLILDAGCGGVPLKIDNITTVGFDISLNQLKTYNGDIREMPLIQGDMVKLPFKDNSFNGVAAFYSYIHIPIKFHTQVLQEFHRVLTPESPLILVDGSDEWINSNSSWLDTGEEMHWSMAGKEKTIENLKINNYNIQDVEPVHDTLGEGTKVFILAETI